VIKLKYIRGANFDYQVAWGGFGWPREGLLLYFVHLYSVVSSSKLRMPISAVHVVDMYYLNLAGLKFLIRLCSDLGLREAAEYALELKKAEKAKEVRERIGSSRPGE
jgi:hypothetical protein